MSDPKNGKWPDRPHVIQYELEKKIKYQITTIASFISKTS